MLKVAVVGSGWGSSSFLKKIDTERHQVTVISPNRNFVYTPLLANNIKNHTELTMDVCKLNNIAHVPEKVKDFAFDENTVITENNEKYKYDYLVLAHGCDINTFNINGVRENCHFIKTAEDTKIIREKLSKLPQDSRVAVIGCGLTGTEIIGNLMDYAKFKIYAIDGMSLPLSTFNDNIRSSLAMLWYDNGINCIFNSFVKKIDETSIYFGDHKIDYDMAIWCGGVKRGALTDRVNKLLKLECNFGIPVDEKMKVKNTKNVFAIGDCAYNRNPPTAQVAYQEGRYLADHLNDISNKEGKPFEFISKGQICYTGQGKSVYQYTPAFYFSGIFCGYFNKVVHVYNSINIEQMMSFIL